MPELSKLFVTIGAKTDAFESGLKRVQKQTKALAIGMVAVGAAIVGALGKAVKDFAAFGDQMQKMALRTGFSTEALSELNFAAEISGATIETLEKAVKRMSAAIVDADNGLLETKRAFDALGLSAGKLLAQSPEEQFFAIAGAIGDLESANIRAATAKDIFGRAGTQLLPLIAQGSEGIKALREEAEKLGIVMSQEDADAAAEFNDALRRLQGGLEGIRNSIGTALIGSLTDLIDRVKESIQNIGDWIRENKDLFASIVETVGKVALLSIAIGGIILLATPFFKAIGIMVTAVKGLSTAVIFLATNPFVLLLAAVAAVAGAAAVLIIRYNDTTEAIKENSDELNHNRSALDDVGTETEAMTRRVSGLRIQSDALTQSHQRQTSVIQDQTTAQTEANAALAEAIRLEAAREDQANRFATIFRSIGAAVQDPSVANPFELGAALRRQAFGPQGPLEEFRQIPETGPAFGPSSAQPIIVESTIVMETGEVLGRAVSESVGQMVGDRQRVEGERP